MTTQIPSLEDLLKAGVHFGHRKAKWHPKMAPFIFTEKEGIHVINLEETQKKLEEVKKFLEDSVSKGGEVIFVATKKQVCELVKNYAKSCSMPYVVTRWLGGIITNFDVIHKLLTKYRSLKKRKESGELEEKYTKKEQLEFDREINRLDSLVGGIENLNKLPAAIFVIDVKKEKTVINEAFKRGIPIIAICDTNVNPSLIKYPIPGNDDAIKSVDILVKFITDVVSEAKEKLEQEQEKKEADKAVKELVQKNN